MRTSTETPCRAAMIDRLSPYSTVTSNGAAVVVGTSTPGITSSWPMKTRSGSVRPFTDIRASTVTPWS